MSGARIPLVARLATVSARRWRVTLIVWAALSALGLYAYFSGLDREGFPPIDVPIVVVDGSFFADDPTVVDAEIVGPLHDAYAGVDGVKEIQSFARANSYAVIVEFETEISSPVGAARLTAVTPSLDVPATLTVRSIEAAKFVDRYDVLVAVNAPPGTDVGTLEAAAAEVATALEADPAIEVAEVRNLQTLAVGSVSGEEELRPTRFSRVALGGDEQFREAVTIGLVRDDAVDLDLLAFSDRVNTLLEQVDLPTGLDVGVTADFATDIRAQLSNLLGSLLTGLVAVAVVSFLLIGWRVSIVTALFMGSVMLAALVSLLVVGYSLNTITLFGLILTLGLLVDDAIVVSEALDAGQDDPDPDLVEAGAPTGVAVVRGAVGRVGAASLAGTLTTVLVFAPMLFVSGILGRFIRAIPATVIITLLVSFLFSMTVVPALGRRLLLSDRGERPASVRSGASPLARPQRWLAGRLGALAAYPSGHGVRGWVAGLGLIGVSVAAVAGAGALAGSVGFDIFPQPKDANNISVGVEFEPGTTVDVARELTRDVDDAVLAVLGDDLVLAQYIRGNERGATMFVDLVPFGDRTVTAPEYVERLEAAIGDLSGARVTVGVAGQGPPDEDFPFAVQIAVGEGSLESGLVLAEDLREALDGAVLANGTQEGTTVTDAIISTAGTVYRVDGARQLEVRASFGNDDTTNNLTAAETFVSERFDATALSDRGLPADTLAFDFGFESDNQDDFASLGVALQVALVLMLILLVVQFRSLVQPLLIFLAIPFSFLGVFGLLNLTDNPLSFFVMVGFIALIGVVVNNSILLVDAANQARRAGSTAAEAMRTAVERRFRPLLATALTTVAGLLPLALSDPFWEALSFTLIGGLVSSTFLVLVAFPVFYVMTEAVRTPLRNAVRRRRGRELIT